MGFVSTWSFLELVRARSLTAFGRGYEVYDRLSPSFAKYLETLEAVHEARFFQQIAAALGNKLRDGMFNVYHLSQSGLNLFNRRAWFAR